MTTTFGIRAHPHRERILTELLEQPGLGFRELARRTGLAAGTLQHHIRILARQGRLWVVPLSPRLLHFPGSKPSDDQARQAVLASLTGLDAAIIAALGAARLNQTQLLHLFRETPESSVQFHLYAMVRRGLLTETRHGRYVSYGLPHIPLVAWPQMPVEVEA